MRDRGSVEIGCYNRGGAVSDYRRLVLPLIFGAGGTQERTLLSTIAKSRYDNAQG